MLGARLHQARKANGLSLRALAEKVGVSAMMLSKYERGESIPSSGILIELSNALGVQTEYFFRTAQIELERVEHRNRHRWKTSQNRRNESIGRRARSTGALARSGCDHACPLVGSVFSAWRTSGFNR